MNNFLKHFLQLALLIFLIFLVIWFGIEHRENFDLYGLRGYLDSFGPWAPVMFMLIFALATIAFIPGTIMMIAGGLLFGVYEGILYAILGTVLGSAIAFLSARFIGANWVQAKAAGKLKMAMVGVEKSGWRFVAITRLVPFIPYNILNYALGLTRIGFWPFIIASAIFTIPSAFAYSYLGSLGETFIYGSMREIIVQFSLAIGLLILLSTLPWFIKRIN